MGFSRVAALHLAPLLARIVLCAAFVPAGWQKIMSMETFTGPDATTIRSMCEFPGNPSPTETVETEKTTESTETVASTETPTSTETGTSEPVEARRVYGLAAMLSQKDVPYPLAAAWITAITELVGGGLLLVGLFSRVWALGLAVTMGVAFSFTSCPALAAAGPFDLALPDYLKAVAQLALGVLAFTVFLTGPGAVALDRAIFRRRRPRPVPPPPDSWDEEA